jgi:hypothetical protein
MGPHPRGRDVAVTRDDATFLVIVVRVADPLCRRHRGKGWAIRWRELEIAPDGTTQQVLRYENLGAMSGRKRRTSSSWEFVIGSPHWTIFATGSSMAPSSPNRTRLGTALWWIRAALDSQRLDRSRSTSLTSYMGHGFTYSNETNRRMREKSRSFSVTSTQPDSRHERASKRSLAKALEIRVISRPSCFAMTESRSPERCHASDDGMIVLPARSNTLRIFRSNAFRSPVSRTPARNS